MIRTEAIVDVSPWPHRVAVALVCVTFPLIWVGGLVTTYDAGMAVPDWPTTYGYNMFLYPWTTWMSGPWDLFIEHGHRLLGSLAGLLTIALNVAVWRYDSRGWLRSFAVLALVLVISQGVLGGMRVRLNSTDLARVHGCTGPLFFAVAVAMSVFTSGFWKQLPEFDYSSLQRSKKVAGGSWLLVAVVYAQLVLGAHLRHPNVSWTPGQFRVFVVFHLLGAAFLLIQVVVVTVSSRKAPQQLRRGGYVLSALVFAQGLLGVATWRAKYGWPSFLTIVPESHLNHPMEISVHNSLAGGIVISESMAQAITVTGHVALGSIILAVCVRLALKASRMCARVDSRSVQPSKTRQGSQIVAFVGGTLA